MNDIEFDKFPPKYKYHLLREEVASQDAFLEKPHEHAANALADIISQENGGITIGLEGSWGSGKSTVINLLQSKLKDTKIFIFDAWAHEGDCLRRIFLESLLGYISSLVESKDRTFCGDSLWIQDKLQTIDCRKQKTTVESHKHPTGMGILFVITLYVASIGTALLGIVNWLAGLLVSAPIIAVVWKAIKLRRDHKKIFDPSNWSFIQADSTDVVEREVSESEERSSIEFERFFTEIMERITEDNPQTKFIFAIDNLDRIAPEYSLSLWSTLQTFLQKRSRGHKHPSWFDKFYIIVPYDPIGLAKIWNGEADSNEEAKNKDKTPEAIAKSFLDKCFQIRLELPVPVMTDWESFASKQIDLACQAWREDEKHTILDVFRFTRSNLAQSPTPREIKNYVNQVCVLRRYCSSEISTACIAYYSIVRFVNSPSLSVEDIRQKLVDGKFIEERLLPYLPKTYAEEFSGLIFGVSPKTGQQLLLTPEIQTALEKGNGDKLKGLSETHGNGFWIIFEHFISNAPPWNSKNYYTNFVASSSAIYNSKIDFKRCDKFIKKSELYIQMLAELSSSDKLFLLPNNDILQKQLLSTVRLFAQVNPELINKLYEPLLASCIENIGSNKKFITESLCSMLSQIVQEFPCCKKKQIEFSSLNIENLLQFCRSNESCELAPFIKPPLQTVNDFYTLVKPNSPIPNFTVQALQFISKTKVFEDFDFMPLAKSCNDHIRYNNGQQQSVNSHSTSVLDLILLIIAHSKKYISFFDELLNDWRFYNFVYHDKDRRLPKALLLSCIVSPLQIYQRQINCIQYTPIILHLQVQEIQQEIQNELRERNEKNARALLEEARNAGLLSYLWKMGENAQILLFEDIVEIAMQNNRFSDVFTGYQTIELISSYKKFIDRANNIENREKKKKEFLAYLNSPIPISVQLINDGINLLDHFDDYREMIRSDYSSKELVTALFDHCKKLSHDDFILYLKKNDDFIDLIQDLRSARQDYFGYEFYSALLKIMTDDSNKTYTDIRNRWYSNMKSVDWESLVAVLEPKYKLQLQNDLTDYFIEHVTDNLENYWKINHNLFIISKFSNHFLNDKTWLAVRDKKEILLFWISSLIEKKSEEWQMEAKTQELIKEPLKTWFENASDETKKLLKFISEKFELSPKTNGDAEEKQLTDSEQ